MRAMLSAALWRCIWRLQNQRRIASMGAMRRGELLTQIPLFEGLSVADADALGERLAERTVLAHQTVFALGDPGDSMYVVVRGAVQIYLPSNEVVQPAGAPTTTPHAKARVVVKEARAGEYFGELALFDAKPRSASVDAISDTLLLELKREVFAEYLQKSPRAAFAILTEMAKRLRETNSLLSQRAAQNVVKELEENLTWGQRVADKVADLNGSWAFILFLLALTAGWALINIFLPQPFDKYPYTFFNLLLAVLVALQGPLIVMSQNRQTTKDRAQAETDYRVNLKNEVNIENIQAALTAFRAETESRLDAMGRMVQAVRAAREVAPRRGEPPLAPPDAP
jgi:CRP/FNR family transcriptional regulator, cyclic AMP receptor protein